MISASDLATVELSGPVLLTIGTFDGVHRGHRFLLDQAAARARDRRYQLVIVTFDPCPAVVLRPSLGRYQLTTADQKLRLLGDVDPTLVVMLRFTHQLAQLTADQFLDAMEGRLSIRELWMGEDFHFGKDRQGGLDMIVQRGGRDGFSVHVVTRRLEESSSISSTRVRRHLDAGEVEDVVPLLGRPFALDLEQSTLVSNFVETPSEASFRIAPHLALPSAQHYAALFHDCTDRQHAVAATVHDNPDYQLTVFSNLPLALSGRLEFLSRLPPDRGQAMIDRANSFIEHWRRPSYPAAGNY